jgi:DNA-binding transcriptional regulator of glucitol operon
MLHPTMEEHREQFEGFLDAVKRVVLGDGVKNVGFVGVKVSLALIDENGEVGSVTQGCGIVLMSPQEMAEAVHLQKKMQEREQADGEAEILMSDPSLEGSSDPGVQNALNSADEALARIFNTKTVPEKPEEID